MKTIAITGTPGSGKTTLAKKLKRKGCILIDIPKLIKNYKLSESYDKKRKCDIININKLNKAIIASIKTIKKFSGKVSKTKAKGIVIDSHLSHYLPKKYVDLCIVTKCNLNILKKRLEKKGYSKSKVRENLDAEIFRVCLNEAKEQEHKIKVVDTTKGMPADISSL